MDEKPPNPRAPAKSYRLNLSFVQKSRVVYCRDFQNTGKCKFGQQKCRFVHVSIADQKTFLDTGIPSPMLYEELGRTMESQQICRRFLRGRCDEPNCKFPHRAVKSTKLWSCPVCKLYINAQKMACAAPCNHVICRECLDAIVASAKASFIETYCPVCRKIVGDVLWLTA